MRQYTPNDTHFLSLELFDRILSEVQTTTHTMQFYFQGEPLLNKHLPEMIARAHQVGIYTIVSTNAQTISKELANALVKSGLSRIVVSIDGFSEESYTAYRVGGSLQKALEGLQFMREAKEIHRSSIRIELQVLRLRTNEHEWEWIRNNYRKLGATHLVFKTAQLYDYEHGNPLMPTKERYSRYKKTENGTYINKKNITTFSKFKIPNYPCYRLWSGCVITTNGDVLPCCYDKDHRYAYGNITQQSLAELFHSTKANALRRRVLLYHGEPLDMCKNCNQ
jgi:radical SAM protein with 4Fe4S-binding SPASM domain